jgi:hypothetical protein
VRLRKLLGDDGYRRFAEWQLAHRDGGHRPGPGRDGGPQRGPRQPAAAKTAFAPGVDADDD